MAQAQREASSHIRRLEKKYGVTFQVFEKKLDETKSLQAHEDYSDWFFWRKVLERVEKASKAMEKISAT